MGLDKTARQNFSRKIRPLIQGDQFDKVSAAITPYVRVRLYEDSFADRVLAVRTVTEAELIPEVGDDSFYVITNVEQATEQAVVANFIDRPSERYLAGQRYKVPLGKHITPVARKSKNELLAYNYDLLQDAAEKDVFELGMLRDWKLINILNECVRVSGRVHEDVVDFAKEGPVQIGKIHTNRLESVLNSGGRTGLPSKNELKTTRFLFNDHTRRDFSLLDLQTYGDRLAEEMFVSGMTVKTLQGIEYISSIKSRLLTEHEAVTLVKFAGAVEATETLVVNGVSFSLAADAATADAAAAGFAAAINASTNPAIRREVDDVETVYVRATASGDTLRLAAAPAPNQEERSFISFDVPVDASGIAGGADVKKGTDRYDIVWAFPDPEFMGEIVRVAGRDIEPEIWKTPGEEMINRVMREWFGMGIGNVNGAAKLRMQRARFLG